MNKMDMHHANEMTDEVLHLPKFMFLEWSEQDDPMACNDRAVIFHTATGSLIEIFQDNPSQLSIAQDRLVFRFGYLNPDKERTTMWAVLLRCPGRDMYREREALVKELIKPACRWFCDDLDFWYENEDFEDDDEDDDSDEFDY